MRCIACIGASAGGVTAVQKILKSLPSDVAASLIITQHFPQDAVIDPQLVYGKDFSGRVHGAIDKMPLESGQAYFAPPGYHLQIERDLSLSLNQDEPVNFARPSIDVLFESAAWSLGADAVGILLTGASADGVGGLRLIHDCGGTTIVQDPEEAESSFMPRAALQKFKPDYVLNLHDIAAKIAEIGGRK